MKRIIFAGVAVLLLAAGCSKSASVQSNTSATVQGAYQSAQTSQTSLKALMMAGTPEKCTVSFNGNNSQTQGTIYVAGGKMRGDFTQQSGTASKTSHMVNDGTTVYTWLDGTNMAMKISVSAMQQMQSTSTAQNMHSQSQAVDPNANYQYNCTPWTVDSSVFTPPANINFMDESQMMMQMHSGSGAMPTGGSAAATMKTQECAACNSVGAGKAQCLAALHC